jgi:hypothetical protein
VRYTEGDTRAHDREDVCQSKINLKLPVIKWQSEGVLRLLTNLITNIRSSYAIHSTDHVNSVWVCFRRSDYLSLLA